MITSTPIMIQQFTFHCDILTHTKFTNNIILVEKKSNKKDQSISVRNGQMSQKWNHQTLGRTYIIILLTLLSHSVWSCIGSNDFFEYFAVHNL